MATTKKKTKTTRHKRVDIYPYRVLYLVTGIAVLSLFMLIQLAMSS